MEYIASMPEWARVIAIQPMGHIIAYEFGCYWDEATVQWMSQDERVEVIGRTTRDWSGEESRNLMFARALPPSEIENDDRPF